MNALKYAGAEELSLLFSVNHKNGIERLCFSDNGGVAPDKLPHLFEQFYQGDESRSNRSGGCNGYDICRKIRDQSNIPILMVTARSESIDKIRGLGLGADDYITKPFDPVELVVRVKAHLNRYDRLINGTMQRFGAVEEDVIQIRNSKIMARNWKVYYGETEIKFPNHEFELLKFLALNPNIVFSKEQLFEENTSNPKIIETVWGAGYRLNL